MKSDYLLTLFLYDMFHPYLIIIIYLGDVLHIMHYGVANVPPSPGKQGLLESMW